MTTKKKEEEGRVKVKELQLNKETVEELGDSDLKEVQGGAGAGGRTGPCVAGAKPDTGNACTEVTCPGVACG